MANEKTAAVATAFPWAAAGMGIMSVVGSFAADDEAAEQLRDEARANGSSAAGTRFAARVRGDLIVDSISKLERSKQSQAIAIEQAGNVQEANIRVNAAQAGVAGDSVDDMLITASGEEARAKSNAEQQISEKQLQLKREFVDINVNAKTEQGKFTARGTGSTSVRTGLAFVSGVTQGLSL